MAEAYPNITIYKLGSKGDKVKLIQEQLSLYYTNRNLEIPAVVKAVVADGNFDEKTDTAVKYFQNEVKILVDGKVGPITWPALFADPNNPEQKVYKKFIGKVLDLESFTPLEGVKVSFKFDQNNTDTVITDKNGQFSFIVSEYVTFHDGGNDWADGMLQPPPTSSIIPSITEGTLDISNELTQSSSFDSPETDQYEEWANEVRFLAVAQDFAYVKNLDDFKALEKTNQDIVLNHLKVNFDYSIKLENVDDNNFGPSEIEYLVYQNPENSTWVYPLNGNGSWKLDMGTIYMYPSIPKNSINAKIENAQLTDEERKALNRKKSLAFVLRALNQLILIIKSKLLNYLYDLLKEFGINNPQQILAVLKNSKDVLLKAEKKSATDKLNEQNKQAVLKDLRAREVRGKDGNIQYEMQVFVAGIDITKPGFYVDRYRPADENETLAIQEALSNIPVGNVKDLPNTWNIPSISNNIEDPTTLQEVGQEALQQNVNPTIKNINSTVTTVQNLNQIDLKDKEVQGDILRQLALLTSLGLVNVKPQCPANNQKLLQVIQLRNNLTTQINNLYKTIQFAQKTVKATDVIILGLQQAKILIISTFTSLPAPAATLTTGAISLLEENKKNQIDRINKQINNARAKVYDLDPLFVVALSNLEKVLTLLKLLDSLIKECSQNLEIPLTEIDQSLTEAITLSAVQGNPVITEYNGFKLEIKQEDSTSEYKRRYAQALNKDGIVLIKGTPSFSSNDQILINEVIFLIEDKNLKAD